MTPTGPTETAGTPLVECRDLCRTYGRGPTAVVAVHGAHCAVYAGQQIALTGPSGSGKSTLLHMLAGLDPPSAGQVAWPALGGPPATLPAGTVAVVFQGPSLLPDLDVVENIAFPRVLTSRSRADVEAATTAARGLLADLGLADLAGKLPEEISGGQAQRVALARALITGPRLIIADEPTGQLDHASATLLITLLVGRAGRLGAGLLVTTHDPFIAEHFSIRWDMIDGRPRVAAPC